MCKCASKGGCCSGKAAQEVATATSPGLLETLIQAVEESGYNLRSGPFTSSDMSPRTPACCRCEGRNDMCNKVTVFLREQAARGTAYDAVLQSVKGRFAPEDVVKAIGTSASLAQVYADLLQQARTVALAQELLEALETITHLTTHLVDDWDESGHTYSEVDEAIEKARTVIENAKSK